MNKRSLYWFCQIGGWLFFILLESIFLDWSGGFNSMLAFRLFLLFFFGVIYTHIYRAIILKLNWLKLSIPLVIPPILISTLFFASLLYFTRICIEGLLTTNISVFETLTLKESITEILNFSLLFFTWSLIYFLVHFVDNYKKAEIENLKWQASINEIELNKLKSQLNPHFIFNSMNSIRALVDESPVKAKDGITQLSSILRSTLLMGKKKLISFDEELAVVKDYLDLESTRLEERLKLRLEIDPSSSSFDIPPLMLQTLVENGIKHGISKLTEGGELSILTKVERNKLHIQIRNSGKIEHEKKGINDTGFGIKNTEQRLQLLFGKEGIFSIEQEGKNVLTKLIIPKIAADETAIFN